MAGLSCVETQSEKEKQLLIPAILWKSRFAETGFALAVSC